MNIIGIEKYLRKFFLRNYRLRGLDYIFDYGKNSDKNNKIYIFVTPVINLYEYFFDEDGKYSPQVVKDTKLSTETLMRTLTSFVSNIKFNKLKVYGRPKAVKKLTTIIGKKIDELAEERGLSGVKLNKVKINAKVKTKTPVIQTNYSYKKIYFANPLSNFNEGDVTLYFDIPYSYKHKMNDIYRLRNDALSSLSLKGTSENPNFYERDTNDEVYTLINQVNNEAKKLYDEYGVRLIDYKVESTGAFPLEINPRDFVPYKKTYHLHHMIELDVNKLNKYSLNFDAKYYEFFRQKNFLYSQYNILTGLPLFNRHNDTLVFLSSIDYKMINRNKQKEERKKFEDKLLDITKNFLIKNNIPYDDIEITDTNGSYTPLMKVTRKSNDTYGYPVNIKYNLTAWVKHPIVVDYDKPSIMIKIPQNKSKEEYQKDLSLSIINEIIDNFPHLNKSDVRIYFTKDF